MVRSAASVEKPAQCIDGIPRMISAAKLIHAQLHHSLFETMPARLSGRIGLIGAQPYGDFALGNNG